MDYILNREKKMKLAIKIQLETEAKVAKMLKMTTMKDRRREYSQLKRTKKCVLFLFNTIVIQLHRTNR